MSKGGIMYTYNILENDHKIGVAKGRENAFKYIQKTAEYNGLRGYWHDDNYIINGQVTYRIERAENE